MDFRNWWHSDGLCWINEWTRCRSVTNSTSLRKHFWMWLMHTYMRRFNLDACPIRKNANVNQWPGFIICPSISIILLTKYDGTHFLTSYPNLEREKMKQYDNIVVQLKVPCELSNVFFRCGYESLGKVGVKQNNTIKTKKRRISGVLKLGLKLTYR